MISVDDVAIGLGKAFLPQEEIGPRLAQRAGKVAATAASRLGEPRDDPYAFARMDVTAGLPGSPGGLEGFVYAPSQYKAEPELFWGPFMQLGTYLEIENPGLRFLVDAIADPINLLTFGTGTLLNSTGKLAKLMSVATKGGKTGRSFAKGLDNVESILKVVGAAAENPQWHARLLESAKKGVTGREWRGLIDEGLAISDKLTDKAGDAKVMLETLRKDRKSYLNLMEAAQKYGDQAAGPEAFLQPGFRARQMAGQTNPFVRVDAPFPLVRQMMGLQYRGRSLFMPLSRGLTGGVLRGLDAMGGSTLAQPLYGLADDLLQGSTEVLKRNIGDLPTAVGTQYTNDLIRNIVLDTRDLGRVDGGLVDEVLPSDSNLKRLKKQMGLKGTSDERLKEILETKLRRDEALSLEAANARIAQRHNELLTDTRQGLLQAGIPALEADEMVAQVKQAHNLFGIGEARESAEGLRDALLARVSAVDVMASNVVYGYRDMMKKATYVDGRTIPKEYRRSAGELLDRMRENPELFSRDGDGITKLVGDVPHGTRIAELFSRDPGFERFAREVGLPRDVGLMGDQMKQMYDALGAHLFETGINPAFVSDYAQRVFRFNDDFFKDSGKTAREFVDDRILGQEVGLPELQEVAEKVKEGKLGFNEARTATERALLAMEKRGMGRFNNDSIDIFGAYIGSANRAVTADLLINDLPKNAPHLTDEMMDAIGLKAKDRSGVNAIISKKDWDKFSSSKQAALAKQFTELQSQPRYNQLTATDEATQAIVNSVSEGGVFAKEVKKAARIELAEQVSNSDKLRREIIGGKGTLNRRKGKAFTPEEFAEMIASNKIPGSVRGARALRVQINGRVAAIEKRLGASAKKVLASSKKKAAKTRKAQSVFVHKSIEPQVRELFRSYGEAGSELIGGKWVNKYDRLNTKLKGLTLAVDIFHQNVLAYSSLVMDPQGAREVLAKQASVIGKRAAIGAAAGATATATVNQDPGAIAMGGIAGALYAGGTKVAMTNAHNARMALLNPRHAETLAWMGRGGFTGLPNDRAIGGLLRVLQNHIDHVRRQGKNVISPLTGAEHVIDAFDHGMWQTMQVGTKQAYFQTLFDKEVAKLPVDLADNELRRRKTAIAKEVMASANTWLGGQRFSWLLGEPKYQDVMRKFLLAPDWTTANLMGAASVMANLGPVRATLAGAGIGQLGEFVELGLDSEEVTGIGAVSGAIGGLAMQQWMKSILRRMTTKGDIMAKEARRIYASALLGGYTFGNLMNKAFTGRWMWENPEGRETSIALGGTDADGKPLYMSLGKPWKEAFEFGSIFERESYPIPVISRTKSKVATIPRVVFALAANDNGFGRPIIDHDSGPWDFASYFNKAVIQNVTPIIGQAPLRAAGALLDPERSVGLSTLAEVGVRGAGFPVRRDPPGATADFTNLLVSSATPPRLSQSIFTN